mgnify:CR=1 FL=1
MANAFDSALVVDVVSSTLTKVLANRLAPLRAFSRDFSTDIKAPGQTIQVKRADATLNTLTNPTNFEHAFATTIGAVSVSLNHIYQPFGLSNADLNNGHKLEDTVSINADAMADAIWAVAIAPVTTPNFGAAVATPGQVTPGSTSLQTLWSTIAKSRRKSLVLAPEIYAKFIPNSTQSLDLSAGAYGFDAIHLATTFTGAVSGLDGFACSPDAIAVAACQPEISQAVSPNFAVRDSVTLEEVGLTVYYNVWGSTATRATHASFELMMGSSALIKSGTMALII